MFYCEKCGEENGWPTDWFAPRSRGPCEICEKVAICYDVPSRAFADAEAQTQQERGGDEWLSVSKEERAVLDALAKCGLPKFRSVYSHVSELPFSPGDDRIKFEIALSDWRASLSRGCGAERAQGGSMTAGWYGPPRYVVKREPGPGTAVGGDGDIVIDNYGARWRVCSVLPPRGTADWHAELLSNGTIRSAP